MPYIECYCISVDPQLGGTSGYELTSSTPTTVSQGGVDLSSETDYPRDGSGNPVDYAGTVRTAPWSMGAFEKN